MLFFQMFICKKAVGLQQENYLLKQNHLIYENDSGF